MPTFPLGGCIVECLRPGGFDFARGLAARCADPAQLVAQLVGASIEAEAGMGNVTVRVAPATEKI